MGEQIFEKHVGLARRCCEKMYLDSLTADVNFTFSTNHSNTNSVPAHKSVLSVGSPVFEAMFYGSIPKKGNISIPDASAEAFKEFLQLFYRNKVRLTSENIADVANLCKKYQVNDGLKACEVPFKKSLTINRMCTGFAMAQHLELPNVIEFCEREIGNHAEEILNTTDFLDCNGKLFDKILQLASSNCSATTMVKASMAWASAECKRKKVHETPGNLRQQLNDSFHRIPFDALPKDQFALHLVTYKEFFTNRDFESIILKKMSNKMHTTVLIHPEQATHTLDCDRKVANSSVDFYIRLSMPYSSFFISNKSLILTELFLAKLSLPDDLDCQVTIFTRYNPLLATQQLALSSGHETHVVLSVPVEIDANIEYGIRINAPMENIGFKRKPLNHTVRLENDINVRFINDKGIVTRLTFKQPIQ